MKNRLDDVIERLTEMSQPFVQNVKNFLNIDPFSSTEYSRNSLTKNQKEKLQDYENSVYAYHLFSKNGGLKDFGDIIISRGLDMDERKKSFEESVNFQASVRNYVSPGITKLHSSWDDLKEKNNLDNKEAYNLVDNSNPEPKKRVRSLKM